MIELVARPRTCLANRMGHDGHYHAQATARREPPMITRSVSVGTIEDGVRFLLDELGAQEDIDPPLNCGAAIVDPVN